MRDKRSADVIVIGGACGSAIAHKLAERGKRVTLLCRNDVGGATDTNQKWLHSGLLYPSGTMAERAWSNRTLDWELKRPYLVGPQYAYILALNKETISQREAMWDKWTKAGLKVPAAQRLGAKAKDQLASLGAKFEDGWKTVDCAIDFPALVADMRRNLAGQLRRNGHFPTPRIHGDVLEGAKVLRLCRKTMGIAGVEYELRGKLCTLSCNQCVLAAGAWSYGLLREIDIDLPLVRKKCLVLAFKRASHTKRLRQITVWLDIKKEDGTQADFTLVPFRGQVLAAGTDFRLIYQLGAQHLEDLKPGPSEIAALRRELNQCFGRPRSAPFDTTSCEPRVCFKTEQYNAGHPDVDLKVYTQNTGLRDGGHGVPGLIVAIPGKASLMFDLAREVSKYVQ